MTMGQFLRNERKKKKLTIKLLSEFARIPVCTLSQYERGVRQPKFKNLATISLLLGFSLDHCAECVFGSLMGDYSAESGEN